MLGFTILASAGVKGSLVLAVAGAAAWAMRKRPAAARHLVWTAAAAALLALPVLTLSLPALRVTAKPEGAMAVFQVFSSGRATAASLERTALPGAALTPPEPRGTDLRRWTAGIWAAGAAVGLLQMLLAFAAVSRLRRGARRLDCGDVAATLGIRHPVEILESARGGMPMTFGLLRPAVLLPAGASAWPSERLRMVLLHELAHVRRGDVATHLLARAALALYWWNPLAWYAWREFLKERERATDDLVLHAGERASEYAGHLLEIARSFQPGPATAWAALAMARRSQLEGRLVAILDSGVARQPSSRRAPLLTAALAIALVAPFAAMEAQDPAIPAEADATIRAADAQKNHELLDRAAAAYEKLARYDVAQKLLEHSLAIREQVGGPGSAAYAAGLVKLGDLAAKRRQAGEAAAFYAKAVALGDRPEVVPALLYLGACAFDANDRRAAEDYFQRVLRLDGAGPNAGRALTWLAVLRQSTPGGEPEAELLYQKALAAEPNAANTITNYAGLLRRQKRAAEGDVLEQRALAARRNTRPLEAAASSRQVFRVGGGVSAPALVFKAEPEYTEAARSAKYQGTVLLYIEVGPDGAAHNIQVVRPLGLGLDDKAIDAVSRWKFRPGAKEGQPVTVAATVEVNFRLL